MGNPAWGAGHHKGYSEGLASGLADGRLQGGGIVLAALTAVGGIWLAAKWGYDRVQERGNRLSEGNSKQEHDGAVIARESDDGSGSDLNEAEPI